MTQATQVTCTECEKTTEVPFTPTAGRPVYCDECFKKKRAAGGPRGGPGGRGGPRGGPGGRGGPRPGTPRKAFSRGDYPGHERFQ
jgi:CxxC-x17-CxxC domain-containing protein